MELDYHLFLVKIILALPFKVSKSSKSW